MSEASAAPVRLDPKKFRDPRITATGEPRAHVALKSLETLWFNTGTLCNLTCRNCYIESSPKNDRLVYLTAAEVARYLDEIARLGLGTRLIGFTGGEPFMNRELPAMLDDVLARGLDAIVLTNAMKPMHKMKPALLALWRRFGDRLTLRVSLDHYGAAVHELERGGRSWAPAIDGLKWLAANGFRVDVASRYLSGENEAAIRAGFGRLFAELGVALDAGDPAALTIFPEMDPAVDVPEITTACWSILGKSPDSVMCASSRMVVKRKGAAHPSVVACTLLALRPAMGSRSEPRRRRRRGPSQPPALRQILRARRRRVQQGLARQFGQVFAQLADRAARRRVDQLAARARLGDQPRLDELRQVKRQRRGRHPQPLGDIAGRHPGGALFPQQPVQLQPRHLPQRAERRDHLRLLHLPAPRP